MSEVGMVGDRNGIELWTRLVSSTDEYEASYARGVSAAAQKYGKVWFSDCIAQRMTGANQPTFQMTWNNNQWEVSLFIIPETTPITPPKVQPLSDEAGWQEIDADDIIIVE